MTRLIAVTLIAFNAFAEHRVPNVTGDRTATATCNGASDNDFRKAFLKTHLSLIQAGQNDKRLLQTAGFQTMFPVGMLSQAPLMAEITEQQKSQLSLAAFYLYLAYNNMNGNNKETATVSVVLAIVSICSVMNDTAKGAEVSQSTLNEIQHQLKTDKEAEFETFDAVAEWLGWDESQRQQFFKAARARRIHSSVNPTAAKNDVLAILKDYGLANEAQLRSLKEVDRWGGSLSGIATQLTEQEKQKLMAAVASPGFQIQTLRNLESQISNIQSEASAQNGEAKSLDSILADLRKARVKIEALCAIAR